MSSEPGSRKANKRSKMQNQTEQAAQTQAPPRRRDFPLPQEALELLERLKPSLPPKR